MAYEWIFMIKNLKQLHIACAMFLDVADGEKKIRVHEIV